MVDRSDFGTQLEAYAGVTMVVIQKEHDQSTILDFDEDPGDGGGSILEAYDDDSSGLDGLAGRMFNE